MDPKFEYQISHEQAEKLTLEHATTESFVFRRKRTLAFLLSGIFAFLILMNLRIPSSSKYQSERSGNSLWEIFIGGVVVAAICLPMGFVSGKLIRMSVREDLSRRIKREVRKRLPGTERRTVSWSEEAIAFYSPMWETKLKWQVIVEILVGEIGIHVRGNGQEIFAIPRIVLPPDWPVEALVATWRSHLSASKLVT